jgi:hypothetical protein
MTANRCIGILCIVAKQKRQTGTGSMLSLIGDRFLNRFLKGFRRPSKGGSTSEAGTEKMNQSGDLEKAETLEKAIELTHKLHHLQGDVNGTSAANQRTDDPQKQNQTE